MLVPVPLSMLCLSSSRSGKKIETTLQAMAECEVIQDFPECAKKGWRYLEATQIKFDERERYKYFRHISKVGAVAVAVAVLPLLAAGDDIWTSCSRAHKRWFGLAQFSYVYHLMLVAMPTRGPCAGAPTNMGLVHFDSVQFSAAAASFSTKGLLGSVSWVSIPSSLRLTLSS